MGSSTGYTDPFATLGLPPTASKAEAKAAFRKLALKCHPDVDPSPSAASRFSEIKRATDMILKGHYATPAAGPGPASAHSAWQAYARTAADSHDWRPRSRNTALWFCAATLVAGFGVFWGALASHEWLSGYTWLTPAEVEDRIRHPTPRRRKLLRLMMQERQAQGQHGQQAEQQQQPRGEPD